MKKEINPWLKERCIATLRAQGFQFSASTMELEINTDTFFANKYDLMAVLDSRKVPATRIGMTVLLRHPKIHGDQESLATKLKLGLNFDRQQCRDWSHANSEEVIEKFVRYVKMRCETFIERGTLQHLVPKRPEHATTH